MSEAARQGEGKDRRGPPGYPRQVWIEEGIEAFGIEASSCFLGGVDFATGFGRSGWTGGNGLAGAGVPLMVDADVCL